MTPRPVVLTSVATGWLEAHSGVGHDDVQQLVDRHLLQHLPLVRVGHVCPQVLSQGHQVVPVLQLVLQRVHGKVLELHTRPDVLLGGVAAGIGGRGVAGQKRGEWAERRGVGRREGDEKERGG